MDDLKRDAESLLTKTSLSDGCLLYTSDAADE